MYCANQSMNTGQQRIKTSINQSVKHKINRSINQSRNVTEPDKGMPVSKGYQSVLRPLELSCHPHSIYLSPLAPVVSIGSLSDDARMFTPAVSGVPPSLR